MGANCANRKNAGKGVNDPWRQQSKWNKFQTAHTIINRMYAVGRRKGRSSPLLNGGSCLSEAVSNTALAKLPVSV
jgi:hypothetical protein